MHSLDNEDDIVIAGAGGPEDIPQRSSFARGGAQIVVVGEVITEEQGFLKGHGTHLRNGALVASVCGVVQRVNKLVVVRPLRGRFAAEVGDVVVGRITETGQKTWNVDVNGRVDARLQLSSINLPGGVLRRRTAEDEMNMRSFFAEEDLISAEVQAVYSDGAPSLHTRSMKYGKLEEGIFIAVACGLVRRTQQHFCTLSNGVDLILGMNGYIWITSPVDPADDMAERVGLAPKRLPIDVALLEKMARVRNAIAALDRVFCVIHPSTIMSVYTDSLANQVPVKDMLTDDNILLLTATAREIAHVDGQISDHEME